jgi:major membrane immunogen (membrane-anchored lipoprotein)
MKKIIFLIVLVATATISACSKSEVHHSSTMTCEKGTLTSDSTVVDSLVILPIDTVILQ